MRRAGNTHLSVFADSKRAVTGVSGFVDTLGKGSLDYSLLLLEPFLPARFPGSSMVEHSAVNRRVASSNLARGAKFSRVSQLRIVLSYGHGIGRSSQFSINPGAAPKNLR